MAKPAYKPLALERGDACKFATSKDTTFVGTHAVQTRCHSLRPIIVILGASTLVLAAVLASMSFRNQHSFALRGNSKHAMQAEIIPSAPSPAPGQQVTPPTEHVHDRTEPPRGSSWPVEWSTETRYPPNVLVAPLETQPSTPTPTAALEPTESMHDGNVCEDNEELFAALCYMKCSMLTNGTAPHRTSPFSCCATKPCGLNEEVKSFVPDEGFDINGEGGLPHIRGACLTDEEYFLGRCYKKCEVLTDSAFPKRVAAATCCKGGQDSCINPFNDWTNLKFNSGGGAGDGDKKTPRGSHWPLKWLTESQ